MDEFDERAIVPCCGLPMCYCECPPWQRDYALILQAVMEECPPVETTPGRDYGDPPF